MPVIREPKPTTYRVCQAHDGAWLVVTDGGQCVSQHVDALDADNARRRLAGDWPSAAQVMAAIGRD